MCYHYSITTSENILEARFDAHFPEVHEHRPVYHTNGFSHRAMPVITADAPDEIQLYQWGLVPHWVKSTEDAKKLRKQTLNAREDTIFEKSSFKSYIGKKRCLVLADGLYEYMEVNGKKFPYHIYMPNHEPFAFGGIYSHWKDENGISVRTFSILTTEANQLMAKIHNIAQRMPLILPRQLERNWIRPDLTREEIKNMMMPLEDGVLQAHPVSRLITSRTENPDQERVMHVCDYPELIP
jgi:putative SOS response-associated peptidase YedK